jgi:Domain of unknown function (DUF1287)
LLAVNLLQSAVKHGVSPIWGQMMLSRRMLIAGGFCAGTAGLTLPVPPSRAEVLPGNKPHIAIVSDTLNKDSSGPLLIHNIGWGTRMEDILFAFSITGHYRYNCQTP